MDLEQIAKRIEWLDEERRKDKTTIATLTERLAQMESNIAPLQKQIKDLSSELTRVSTMLARFDQVEASIGQVRADLTRAMEANERGRIDREREVEKIRRTEMESVNKAIGEVRRGLDPIPEMRKAIQARQEEEFRLSRMIEEVQKNVLDTHRYDEEYKRTLKLMDENRRQDSKRLTDMVGEVASVRKRLDEQRGKVDLTADSLRKFDVRLSEIQAAESERRQAQVNFIEKQTMANVERERTWKEWLVRFEAVEKSASGLDAQWQNLDATHRAAKKAVDSLDEVTGRFERRINEITEMQRLSEDRFRQEWVSYKADDQKRWSNYTLTQEEHQRETSRLFDKMLDRVVAVEDASQEMQDQLHQAAAETAKRLQSLLALSHEWMSAYESAFGRAPR